MKIYPAIDLYKGEAVRLERGQEEERKSYGDPMIYAKEFQKYVDMIHIVDLEGAFEGLPKNLEIVKDIVETYDIDVQIGGGFRELSSISEAYSAGVKNVVISTKAFDEEFLISLTNEFDGVTVSLDLKGGKLVTDGWRTTLDISLEEGLDMLTQYVDRFIYTITEKDGLLEGIGDVPYLPENKGVIYAGGVTSKEDVISLEDAGYDGCIIGKALYEGEIDIKELTRC
ncbi:MAG: 1-(5-phosphoribosyl)-5-((5-phosphoribosylamino)methylideneamino)imidazole-4-carboxamide isomerase [Candidatus Natronoplasma sp.]